MSIYSNIKVLQLALQSATSCLYLYSRHILRREQDNIEIHTFFLTLLFDGNGNARPVSGGLRDIRRNVPDLDFQNRPRPNVDVAIERAKSGSHLIAMIMFVTSVTII